MKTFRSTLHKVQKRGFGSHSEVFQKRIKTDKTVNLSEMLEETLQELSQTEAFQFNS